MKKLTLIAGVFAMVAMTSCKKDYTCECTTPMADGTELTTEHELNDYKKGDAEDACDELDGAAAIANGNCQLK